MPKLVITQPDQPTQYVTRTRKVLVDGKQVGTITSQTASDGRNGNRGTSWTLEMAGTTYHPISLATARAMATRLANA